MTLHNPHSHSQLTILLQQATTPLGPWVPFKSRSNYEPGEDTGSSPGVGSRREHPGGLVDSLQHEKYHQNGLERAPSLRLEVEGVTGEMR